MGPDEEEKLLRLTALQSVQAILEARHRAEEELLKTKDALQEETRSLELLNQTGTMLASTLDLEAIVQAVTDAATKMSGAHFGAFFYTQTNPEGGVFTLYTLSGAPREAFEKFGHPRATALFGPTFRAEAVIRIADVYEDARYGKSGPHFGMPPGHLPVRSYLAVPVVSRTGSTIGGLFFGHPEPAVFTERAERLVVAIAAQAAVAIDNARLFEESKRAADERAKLLEAERAARAEVERVSLVKDEFLSTLSHELRTPLNAILGWAQIMISRTADDTMRRAAETIERNGRAQAQLIDDLLDMSRIASGKMRLDVQKVDLALVLETVIESMRPSAESKRIILRATIDPHAGAVIGDPSRLQQVVWNLLTNAMKFTPKGGKVDVILQRVNSHLELVVHDTGIGIDPEFLPYVFQRFRQADSSAERKYGGLGLGLSIVKHLVELHGGSVTAESSGVGHGATFIVNLPLRPVRDSVPSREHPTTDREGGVRAPAVSLAGLKILVVDDEPDARDMLRELLQDVGAHVITAPTAIAGVDLLRTEKPDVIVSDVGMPDRDGYQFIVDVRALSAADGGRTPAIAFTAFARSEDRTRALLMGYDLHFGKPINPPELVAGIKRLADARPESAT